MINLNESLLRKTNKMFGSEASPKLSPCHFQLPTKKGVVFFRTQRLTYFDLTVLREAINILLIAPQSFCVFLYFSSDMLLVSNKTSNQNSTS